MKILKKGLVTFASVLLLGTSAFAEISFTGALKAGSGVGTVRAGKFEDSFGTSDSVLNMTCGFDLNAQFGFKIKGQNFFLRPGFSMLFNNGLGNGFKFTYEDYSIGTSTASACAINVTTIDIPLYFGYRHSAGEKVTMEYYMGPYLSFPLAGKIRTAEENFSASFVKPVFGAAAGLDCTIKAGIGSVVLGADYMFDFTATKLKISDAEELVYARREISLNAGYRFTF